MPIYEFRCRDCATSFEELMRSAGSAEVSCPNCQSKNVERLISVFGFSSGSTSSVATGSGSSCSGCASKNCSSCH